MNPYELRSTSGILLPAILSCGICLFSACSSTPVAPEQPAWVRQPTRAVDGGFIVYVGTGEDRTVERSRFKAESMALQDLANECTFTPKGARIEDHHDEATGTGLHRSYAKVAIDFQSCEEARNTVEPEAVRKLANAQLTEQIKRYQDLVDEPESDETEMPVLASAESSSSQLSDPARFFVFRQRVAYMKQLVILAPATEYTSGNVATRRYLQRVRPATAQIRAYETLHPQLQKSPEAFSGHRSNPMAHLPSALREDRMRGTGRRNAISEARRIERAPHQGHDQSQVIPRKGKRRRRF